MTPDLSDEALDALDADLLQWCEQWAPDLDSKVGQVRAAIRGLRERLEKWKLAGGPYAGLIQERDEWEEKALAYRERAERAEAELAKRHEDEHGGPCPWERERDSLLAERDRLRERLVNAHASLEHLMAYHATCHGGTEDQLRERAERAEAEADRTADAFTSLHETHQRVAIERDRLRAALEKVSGTDPDDAAGCGSIARRALEGK